METIKEVLMRRDGMDEDSAEQLIEEAKAQLEDYLAEGDMDSALDICQEFFGLEPDYIDELLMNF